MHTTHRPLPEEEQMTAYDCWKLQEPPEYEEEFEWWNVDGSEDEYEDADE